MLEINSMLTRTKKFASLALSLAHSKNAGSKATCTCVSGYGFTTTKRKWNQQKFAQMINQQIVELESINQVEDADNEDYFQKHNWTIKYIPEKALFQFSKVDGDYEIKALTLVKRTPPNDMEDRQTLPQQDDDQSKRANFSQVIVNLKKTGSEKWFVAHVAVFDGSVEIIGLSFTTEEPTLNWRRRAYPGPQLSTLPQEVEDGVNTVLKQLGITFEILINMVIHSSTKIEDQDATWLKNMREVLI